MTWLFIEPADVWAFRDARSMAVAGGHVVPSRFPPTPQTVQGALRALVLGHSRVGWQAFREQSTPAARDLGEQIGYPAAQGRAATLGTFAMSGPFLARRENGHIVRYVPLPYDVRRTQADPPLYFTLKPMRRHAFATNQPLGANLAPLWPDPEIDIEEPEPLWLSADGLCKYLAGEMATCIPEKDWVTTDALFGSEPRLGIALDYRYRRPVEHMLYQIAFVRPERDTGLLVYVNEGVSLPSDEGALRLGGESRAAYYRQVVQADLRLGATESSQPSQRFKMVLLTPAYFDGGWQPQDGDAGWSHLLGAPVKLISAALGRPQPIGGWDVTQRGGRGWHKPMYAYVPAGSVYFFEAEEEMVPPTGPVTQTPPGEDLPLAKLGFGQIGVGSWTWLD